jgi:L,D-transpeptidase catalytic domain
MSLPKFFALFSILLFGLIGLIALFKEPVNDAVNLSLNQTPLEIELDSEIQAVAPALNSPLIALADKQSTTHLPDAHQIESLFVKDESRSPFVETLIYKSHVPWQKGRPAWLSDYAAYYETSRHFIARSLNGKPDYFKQDIAEGDRFNVFRKDKKIAFHLVVDTSRCKMWFYCLDQDTKQIVLLKTYQVGLGRIDSSKTSGLLTPLGTYSLGDRIAIYKPKATAVHQGKKTEMLTVFGTRWIPFEKEVEACTAPARGFGIHGTPWRRQGEEISDNAVSIGHYESDGCIRLATADIEELFAIIITKPTTIEIVHDFGDSTVANIKP